MTAQVNDRYFVSDVTSYSAGNFTAAPWRSERKTSFTPECVHHQWAIFKVSEVGMVT